MFPVDVVERFRTRYDYEESLIEHLGLRLVGHTGDSLIAEFSVTNRSRNSQHILHGGVSAFVVETLSSFASLEWVRTETVAGAGGVSLAVNYVNKGELSTKLRAKTTALRAEGGVNVWETKITAPKGRLVCAALATVRVFYAEAGKPRRWAAASARRPRARR